MLKDAHVPFDVWLRAQLVQLAFFRQQPEATLSYLPTSKLSNFIIGYPRNRIISLLLSHATKITEIHKFHDIATSAKKSYNNNRAQEFKITQNFCKKYLSHKNCWNQEEIKTQSKHLKFGRKDLIPNTFSCPIRGSKRTQSRTPF